MRLTELNPRWVSHGGDGVTRDGQPVPYQEKVAISFDCPCGSKEHPRVIIMFTNPVGGGPPTREDSGHTWQRIGETFEVLTLTPSILRVGGCGWHGFITNGEVIKV